MAKKSAPAALQTEVNTDEEWEKVLQGKGLLVVDIYSDWSGPCLGMVSTLRKIKMEIGGDVISYAVAKNDGISDLERFRGKSEPVWMFVQNGVMVNLMFGAHCPNLQRLLIEEIRRTQHAEPPKWQTFVNARGPVEQQRWEKAEEIRLAKEAVKAAKEAAEKKAKYEAMLSQMMFDLCEETALLLFPWVFKDDDGGPKDKENCPAYSELVHDLFEQCFDVVEEVRLLLDEDIIDRMFFESDYEITENISYGLMDGKCMVMRLKGRPPHPEWPVPYPAECPEGVDKVNCPIRAIDDVENYLLKIIHDKPPPLLPKTSGAPAFVRQTFAEPYSVRFVHTHEADPDDEGDVNRVYPGVWVPPQVKYKTGNEIFVVVIRKISEDAFLAFAGIGPYYVSESLEEAEEQVDLYFPQGMVDELPEEPEELEDSAEEDENEEDEEEQEEEEGEEMIDFSAF